MQYRNAMGLVVAVGLMPCLISCDQAGGDGRANVRVLVQGLATVDNALEVSLYAGPDGTDYFFEVSGTAGVSTSDFTLNVYYGADDTGPLEYTVNFSLPNADANAQPGESGYGSVAATIFDNPGSWTTVVIGFVWGAVPWIRGQAEIDLEFSHAPRILEWSVVPGQGVAAGETVAVQGAVEFFGTGGGVVAQFWDNEAAGGSLVGTAGTLADPETDGVWNGSVVAVAGADRLRLTASDDEGSMISEMVFVVP